MRELGQLMHTSNTHTFFSSSNSLLHNELNTVKESVERLNLACDESEITIKRLNEKKEHLEKIYNEQKSEIKKLEIELANSQSKLANANLLFQTEY